MNYQQIYCGNCKKVTRVAVHYMFSDLQFNYLYCTHCHWFLFSMSNRWMFCGRGDPDLVG